MNFTRDGYEVLRGVAKPKAVEALRKLFDLAAQDEQSKTALYTHIAPATTPPPMSRLMNQWLNRHRNDDESSTRRWIGLAQAALGGLNLPPVRLFQDVLLEKTATHRPFPWHQDAPFWPIEPRRGWVVWLALDPVDRSRGGVEVMPASHRWGLGPAIDLFRGTAQPGWTQQPPTLDNTGVIPTLCPGDALIFDGLTWHRSGLNHSGTRRRAWATTWIPRDSKFCSANAPRHPLAGYVSDGARAEEFTR